MRDLSFAQWSSVPLYEDNEAIPEVLGRTAMTGSEIEKIKREVLMLLTPDVKRLIDVRLDPNAIVETVIWYSKRRDSYLNILKACALHLLDPQCELRSHIHSVTYRVKDPLHLADKIRRKALPLEGASVIIRTPQQLLENVTDLAGIRILLLYKYHWAPIHTYFCTDQLTIRDQTGTYQMDVVSREAKLRQDENAAEYIDTRPSTGFEPDEIEKPDTNYTSLHYTLKVSSRNLAFKPVNVELQVRTLFEEAWGEIDHQRGYPYKAAEPDKTQLALLNKATSTAVGIASSFRELDKLPKYVSWDEELELERASKRVLVFSRDLRWAYVHLPTLIAQLHDSDTEYEYFVPPAESDPGLSHRILTVQKAVRAHRFSDRLRLRSIRHSRIPSIFDRTPVFADILLLERTLSRRELLAGAPTKRRTRRDICVVGAGIREGQISDDTHDRVDAIIDSKDDVAIVRTFFSCLRHDR